MLLPFWWKVNVYFQCYVVLIFYDCIFCYLCYFLRACVNHFLHDCVYQNGVWNRAFFQEEPDELTAVLQNEPLRVLYNLVNPSPSRKPTEVRKMDKVEEENKELIESRGPNELPEHTELPELPELPEHTELLEHKELLKNLGDQVVLETLDEEKRKKGDPLLQDLSLLYKITEKQGWYKNKQDQCYFIRFKDLSKKSMDILFPAISSTELDSLIRQVLPF